MRVTALPTSTAPAIQPAKIDRAEDGFCMIWSLKCKLVVRLWRRVKLTILYSLLCLWNSRIAAESLWAVQNLSHLVTNLLVREEWARRLMQVLRCRLAPENEAKPLFGSDASNLGLLPASEITVSGQGLPGL